MFENLSDKLHGVFKKLRGQTTLNASNISDAMEEIRSALIEADVNVRVAGDFVRSLSEKCLGEAVLKSVTPAQQVVKFVNDELVKLLGGDGSSDLALDKKLNVIMLVGLHGSGKTTSAGKLARYLKEKLKRNVLLVAGDVYRPAAIDQLEFLGREIGVPVHSERTSVNVPAIAANAVSWAEKNGFDTVIIDTAGRLQIDESMVQELIRIRQAVMADEVLLVADAALGQEAVSVAEHFHNALELTGVILTKLDGDSRGGAALSISKVTSCPIKFAGSGEKLDALEVFHADRMASRILGMGDVVSLVEKAAEEIDEAEAQALQKKLKQNKFDYNDFLGQLRQISRMGGLESIMRFLPGGREMRNAINSVDMKEFARMEAIILSMTKEERENPDILSFPRKKRIARGCGLPVEKVSALTKQFDSMRRMLKPSGALGRMMSGGAVPSMTPQGMLAARPVNNIGSKEQERRKRLAKMKKKDRQKQHRKKR